MAKCVCGDDLCVQTLHSHLLEHTLMGTFLATLLKLSLSEPWQAQPRQMRVLNSLPQKHTFPSQCSTKQAQKPAEHGMCTSAAPARIITSGCGRASFDKGPTFWPPLSAQRTQACIAKHSSRRARQTERSISKHSMHSNMVIAT